MSEQPHEDWDPRADEVMREQIKAYDEMRRTCPVAWSNYQHWTLFRHDDVKAALESPATFSNDVSAHLSVPNGMDPPEHTAYRKLIEPYFAPEAMARFEPICRDIAGKLIGAIRESETLDVVARLGQRYALQVQSAFMGWPESLEKPLAEWTMKNQRATLAGDREALRKVAGEFDSHIRALLAARREAPGGALHDVTASLMSEKVNGRPLTDEELVSLIRNWTVGELATISASISILCHYLASHPELFQQLKAHPDELPRAIDEILRIDAPLISNRRETTQDVALGGRIIPAGARVTLLWASANRDEDVFGNPDEYCPHENAGSNLLYGAGIHVCPGAPLARMELRILMEQLLSQTSRIELLDEESPVRARFPAGGFSYLPLSFVWSKAEHL